MFYPLSTLTKKKHKPFNFFYCSHIDQGIEPRTVDERHKAISSDHDAVHMQGGPAVVVLHMMSRAGVAVFFFYSNKNSNQRFILNSSYLTVKKNLTAKI